MRGVSERGVPQETNNRHRRLLRARAKRPRRRAAEKRDERAPLYPNHAIPRACAVWVRLKRTLAALAHFARCLGRRPFAASGGRRDDRLSGLSASPIKRARATKAEVEARRAALLDIIEAGRPMTVRQVFLPSHGSRASRESGERLPQGPNGPHHHAPDGGAGLAWLAHVCAATRGATGVKV